jgi:hypothetical protein
VIPVIQTIPFEEGSIVLGNCLQAAVASILERPIDAVPHFVQFRDWGAALRLYVEGEGNSLLLWKVDEPQDRPLLAFGKSPRGDFRHAVVWQAGRMIHDPHPDGTGLDGRPEEFWGITEPQPVPDTTEPPADEPPEIRDPVVAESVRRALAATQAAVNRDTRLPKPKVGDPIIFRSAPQTDERVVRPCSGAHREYWLAGYMVLSCNKCIATVELLHPNPPETIATERQP